MPRKVTLDRIEKGIRLGNNGVTIRVDDPDNPGKSGKLRVGRRVFWRPAGKGQIERAENWEDVVDFFMMETR